MAHLGFLTHGSLRSIRLLTEGVAAPEPAFEEGGAEALCELQFKSGSFYRARESLRPAPIQREGN